MNIIRKANNHVRVGSLKPGACILHNGNFLITTNDYDCGCGEVICVDLDNGKCSRLDINDIVLKVNATLTVED